MHSLLASMKNREAAGAETQDAGDGGCRHQNPTSSGEALVSFVSAINCAKRAGIDKRCQQDIMVALMAEAVSLKFDRNWRFLSGRR